LQHVAYGHKAAYALATHCICPNLSGDLQGSDHEDRHDLLEGSKPDLLHKVGSRLMASISPERAAFRTFAGRVAMVIVCEREAEGCRKSK